MDEHTSKVEEYISDLIANIKPGDEVIVGVRKIKPPLANQYYKGVDKSKLLQNNYGVISMEGDFLTIKDLKDFVAKDDSLMLKIQEMDGKIVYSICLIEGKRKDSKILMPILTLKDEHYFKAILMRNIAYGVINVPFFVTNPAVFKQWAMFHHLKISELNGGKEFMAEVGDKYLTMAHKQQENRIDLVDQFISDKCQKAALNGEVQLELGFVTELLNVLDVVSRFYFHNGNFVKLPDRTYLTVMDVKKWLENNNMKVIPPKPPHFIEAIDLLGNAEYAKKSKQANFKQFQKGVSNAKKLGERKALFELNSPVIMEWLEEWSDKQGYIVSIDETYELGKYYCKVLIA